MKRTKLKERLLPDYSTGEEIFNSVSHIVGALFGVFAIISCVIKATRNNNTLDLTGAIIYGMCCLFMFTMSSVYHGSTVVKLKKVFQVIDHCGVYLMVAGCYTPIMLSGLYRENKTFALVMLVAIWIVAIIGISLKCYDLTKFSTLALVMLIVMGWSVVITFPTLIHSIELANIVLIIGGGISYSIGAALFAIGAKKKYFHSVFHIFVDVGAVLHYIAIIRII